MILGRIAFTGHVFWRSRCLEEWVDGRVVENSRLKPGLVERGRSDDGKLEDARGEDAFVKEGRVEDARVGNGRVEDTLVECDRREYRQLEPQDHAEQAREWRPYIIMTISLTCYFFKAFLAWLVLEECGIREIMWTI